MKRPKTIVTPDGITTLNGQGQLSKTGLEGEAGEHPVQKVQKTGEGGPAPKKKAYKNLMQRDADGNIIYPIVINNSLMI